MVVVLHQMPLSAPCRAVMMLGNHLNLGMEYKLCSLLTGDNRTPEYLAMNPQHTVPTMDDNGFYLTESRAMLTYLVSAYGKDDSLYPKDIKKRALVDSRLDFDLGTLYKAFTDAYYCIFLKKQKPEQANKDKFDETLGFFETFLTKTAYAAGDNLTIADFSFLASLTTAVAVGHDISKFPKITAYLEKCKTEIKGYKEANEEGLQQFAGFITESLKAC